MKGREKLSAFAPRACVVAAGLALSFPVWFYGWAAAGDVVFHASWYAHFSAQLGAGELYPRWLAGMNAGLGSPAFYYYPALPYHFAALVGLFVPDGEYGLRALGAAAALAFTLSGLTAYAWLRTISDARSAAAASVIYLLVPYHSAVDLYTREAYAELWAFVWMPLALRFARGLGDDSGSDSDPAGNNPDPGPAGDDSGSDRPKSDDSGASPGSERGTSFGNFRTRPRLNFRSRFGLTFGANFVWLAVAYALLVASHLPAALIFSPVPLAYACLAARGLRPVVPAACALALGAGLAAVYLFPALAMQDAVSFGNMLAFHYMERWVTFARADARDLYGLLLWGTLTALALTACALFARRPPELKGDARPPELKGDAWPPELKGDARPRQSGGDARARELRVGARRTEITFWIVAAGLSAWLMTSASDPVWRALTVLQRVQFPWRFGLVLSVAAAAVVALGLGPPRETGARASRRMLAFGGLLVAAWLVLLVGSVRRAYPLMPGRGFAVAESARSMYAHGRDALEYRPRWTNLTDEGDIERMLHRVCGETPREVKACGVEGDGTVSVTRRGPRELELTVESAGGLRFLVTQFYFPGWAARLDGRTHPLSPSTPDGLLALAVPGGPHRLRLTLEPTTAERAGQLTSAASLALLLLLRFALNPRKSSAAKR